MKQIIEDLYKISLNTWFYVPDEHSEIIAESIHLWDEAPGWEIPSSVRFDIRLALRTEIRR